MPAQAPPQTAISSDHTVSEPRHVDTAVGTHDVDECVDVNLSSIEPPNPENMAEPPRTPRTYNVFTAGDRVGIQDGRHPLDTHAIASLPFFSMRKFQDWNTALDYYTQMYRARAIYVGSSAQHQIPVPHAPAPVPLLPVAPTAAIAPVAAASGPPAVPGTATIPPAPAPTAPTVPVTSSTVPQAPSGIISAPTLPNTFASPLGEATHPIFVSSAFPTPDIQPKPNGKLLPIDAQLLEPDEHPLAIDKLLPPSSRLQKTIQDARLSPSSGRSKSSGSGQQKLSFPKSSATKVIRKGKGKGKASTNKLDHFRFMRRGNRILEIVNDDSDKDDRLSNQNEKKTSNHSNASSLPPLSVPSITLTTQSTAAPAVLVTTTVSASAMLQTPPNKRARLNTSQVGFRPSPATPDANEEYNLLVQAASKTPRSAEGSARRLAIIKEALATQEPPSPTPSPFTGSDHRCMIIQNIFDKTPTPKAVQGSIASPSTPSLLFPLTPAQARTPGPSTTPSVVSKKLAQSTSPETDYGLDSDMDSAFLEEASVFLDRGYTGK